LGGLQWHDFDIKFNENLLIGSKGIRGTTDSWKDEQLNMMIPQT
jgi:hypothetical protein